MRKLPRESTFGLAEKSWKKLALYHLREMCPEMPQGCETDRRRSSPAQDGYRIWGFNALLKPVRSAAASLAREGNPFVQERAKRADWTKGLDVKTFNEKMEIFYFLLLHQLRCELMEIAKATVEILNKAGVEFGIIGYGRKLLRGKYPQDRQ